MRWIKFTTLGSFESEERWDGTVWSHIDRDWVSKEKARARGYLPEDECKLQVAKFILELHKKPKGLGEYGDLLLAGREAKKLFSWDYECVTFDTRREPNAKRLAQEFLKSAPEGALTIFYGSAISAGPGVSAGSTWTAAWIVIPKDILEQLEEEVSEHVNQTGQD
jgi:hypothetical protein